MRVLSVASEAVPFVKTGGLADVAGALPRALAGLGVEMRLMLPGYRPVLNGLSDEIEIARASDLYGGPARVLAGTADGRTLYALDAPHLYLRDGGGPYLGPDGRDWPDNPQRFAALSWMAAEIARTGAGDWRPDVLHGHDWQAGWAPYYLRRAARRGPPSVLTVHNIAFHGAAPAGLLSDLRLDAADFTSEGFEFYGGINALKAGLVYADALTTVSPSYGRELMRPEFGAGLDGVIRARAGAMHGILNGIDTDVWNPATDPAIPVRFTAPEAKSGNTAALRAAFGLPETDGPLCVVVSRMTEQKGLDLLLAALPTLREMGGQLILLGSGDAGLETAWQDAAQDPGVAVHIGYDEALSHRVIAGGDAILVPSRFEPCGLTQLYGLRYGTVPVVARTGGLADTVVPANAAALDAGVATGLMHDPGSVDSLRFALRDLCTFFQQRDLWRSMQRNGMAQPVGWARSAAAYRDLYATLTEPS